MNTGKTLFAQLMDFLPWTTFTRIVDRYGGDHRVRTLSCAEQYRSMAFAQLTYRESLRDIEIGPRIETLSHGLPPAGPALDAGRCQRRSGHPGEDAVRLGLDLTKQSLCACRSFRGRKPAGQHSEFYPHLCPRYALAGSRSHLRRGSWLNVLHQAGAFFVVRS